MRSARTSTGGWNRGAFDKGKPVTGSRKRWGCLVVLLSPVLACALLFAHRATMYRNPEVAYEAFCNSEGLAEDQLMDPLVLAGPGVIPHVVRGVRDRNMPRRGYAILFLGMVEATEALPVLRSILDDDTEKDIVRGDALRAIALLTTCPI